MHCKETKKTKTSLKKEDISAVYKLKIIDNDEKCQPGEGEGKNNFLFPRQKH